MGGVSNAGRPRKPTQMKKLQGTFRKDRSLQNEMKVDLMKDFEIPDDLPDLGKKEWKKITEQLRSAGVLTEVDRGALWALCNEWAKYKEAEEIIRQEGSILLFGKNKYPMANPREGLSAKYFKQYREMAIQFGLTPSSRTRVSGVQKSEKPEDPMAEAIGMKVIKKAG
jgi:P27 family predicted phage terminase small subunit